LYKDVALLLKDGDMLHFRRLLGVLATRVWSLLKIETLSTELGISRYTLEKYLYVLENTFLIHTIKPFFGWNNKNEIRKMNKYYMHDVGMLRYLCQVQDRVGDFKGRVWENWLCNELLYRKHRSESVMFWALTSWGEIDFIIKNDFTGKVRAIECKTYNDASPSVSFVNFLDTYIWRVDHAMITTATQTDTMTMGSHTIYKVPWLYAGLHR
jgi:predicted AAA+ superfamily ATPase